MGRPFEYAARRAAGHESEFDATLSLRGERLPQRYDATRIAPRQFLPRLLRHPPLAPVLSSFCREKFEPVSFRNEPDAT